MQTRSRLLHALVFLSSCTRANICPSSEFQSNITAVELKWYRYLLELTDIIYKLGTWASYEMWPFVYILTSMKVTCQDQTSHLEVRMSIKFEEPRRPCNLEMICVRLINPAPHDLSAPLREKTCKHMPCRSLSHCQCNDWRKNCKNN